jgi:hypothetical protein
LIYDLGKLGNESFALVEYAPFQKIPQDRKKGDAKKKPDARIGTILEGAATIRL